MAYRVQRNVRDVCTFGVLGQRYRETCGGLFGRVKREPQSLKKNKTTPRPSEHPPVMGGKMSKRLFALRKGASEVTTGTTVTTHKVVRSEKRRFRGNNGHYGNKAVSKEHLFVTSMMGQGE